jgi:hypothetical protein
LPRILPRQQTCWNGPLLQLQHNSEDSWG